MRLTAVLALALATVTPAVHAQDKPLPPDVAAPVEPDVDDPEAMARARIERELERPISVSFDGVPLTTVLDHVRQHTRIDAVLDPEVAGDHPVTVAAEEIKVRYLLDRALEGSGVQMRIWSGALVFTRPGKDLGDPPRLRPDEVDITRATVTWNFDDVPLAEVLGVVCRVERVARVEPAAQERVEAARVRLHLRDVAAHHAFTLLTHLHGLTWRLDPEAETLEEVLVIDVRRPRERLVAPPPERVAGLTKQELEARLDARVSVSLVEGTLHELAAQLEQRARLQVRLENAGKEDVLDLELEEVTVRDLLDIVCDVHGARWTIEEGVIVLQVVPRCGECGEPRGNVSPCPACGGR